MPTQATERKNADLEFFYKVVREPTLVTAMKIHGLTYSIGPSLGNAVLGVTKNVWTLKVPGHEGQVNIHFEARTRSEFRLEVGLEPYIGSLESKPDLLAQLLPAVQRKNRLIAALRHRLVGATDLPRRLQANTNRLLAADAVSSHTAVKFSNSGLSDNPTLEATAQFFAEVITQISPIIETFVAREA